MIGGKGLRGLKPINKEALVKDESLYRCFYEDKFMSMEELIPFKAHLDKPPYRFRWVLKKVGTGKSCLDFGCGNGALVNLLEKAGCDAMGVELSEKIVEVAKQHSPGCAFFTDFPKNMEFDVIIALEVIEHLPDPEGFLRKCKDACKAGGKLYFTVPVGKNFDSVEHLNYFDFYQLEELISSTFDNFKIYRIFKYDEEEQRSLFAVEIWN